MSESQERGVRNGTPLSHAYPLEFTLLFCSYGQSRSPRFGPFLAVWILSGAFLLVFSQLVIYNS